MTKLHEFELAEVRTTGPMIHDAASGKTEWNSRKVDFEDLFLSGLKTALSGEERVLSEGFRGIVTKEFVSGITKDGFQVAAQGHFQERLPHGVRPIELMLVKHVPFITGADTKEVRLMKMRAYVDRDMKKVTIQEAVSLNDDADRANTRIHRIGVEMLAGIFERISTLQS